MGVAGSNNGVGIIKENLEMLATVPGNIIIIGSKSNVPRHTAVTYPGFHTSSSSSSKGWIAYMFIIFLVMVIITTVIYFKTKQKYQQPYLTPNR